MNDFPTPKTLQEATALQRELAAKVDLSGELTHVRTLAALDASYKKGEALVAAAVLWDVRAGRALEVGFAATDPDDVFPYVPGYLSFREAPAYLAALAELSQTPDLLLVDGQGIAHPRGLGIASHLGVHLNVPSLGVAKSLLYGKMQSDLANEAGSAAPLVAKGKQIGWVYRSRTGVNPLYLSPGHRVELEAGLEFVRALPGKTKLPEPLRQAHVWSGRARKEGLRGRVAL